MWNLIESFNLRKLHEILPVKNDEWNQLTLKGVRNNEYNVNMTHQKSLDNTRASDFVDSYVMFKTQKLTAPDGLTHYHEEYRESIT